jgi:hypothetical protein
MNKLCGTSGVDNKVITSGRANRICDDNVKIARTGAGQEPPQLSVCWRTSL